MQELTKTEEIAFLEQILDLRNTVARKEAVIVSLMPVKALSDRLATEMLQSGLSGVIYELLPIKDIVLLKIKAGLPLHDDEIGVVEDLMK